MTTTITTAGELDSIVTGGGTVSISEGIYLVEPRKVIVAEGKVDLTDTVIMGMNIKFIDCTVTGSDFNGFNGFSKCDVTFYDSTVEAVQFNDCTTNFRNSKVSYSVFSVGSLFLTGSTTMKGSKLRPLTLYATQEKLAKLHKDELNELSTWTSLDTATATCSNFGPHKGSVHYLKELNLVIANKWQGTLEEFLEEAERETKAKHEAVYNYFKLFN